MDDRIFAIGDELAASMPAPQEHAIESNASEGEPEHASDTARVTDRFGRSFDPAIHSTDDMGNPRFTNSGKLRIKRGSGSSYIAGAENAGTRNAGADALAAGQAIADAIIGSAHMLMGDEWAPRIDPSSGMNERLALGMAWGRYFEARGMRDIPPGWALTIVMCSYAVPRLTQPQTQTRLGKIGAWCKEKIGGAVTRWRMRRARVVA